MSKLASTVVTWFLILFYGVIQAFFEGFFLLPLQYWFASVVFCFVFAVCAFFSQTVAVSICIAVVAILSVVSIVDFFVIVFTRYSLLDRAISREHDKMRPTSWSRYK